jgi:crotonobetainyl-CoA:carnitine CoA-transferase CaiB-like acyl-CoA transferase
MSDAQRRPGPLNGILVADFSRVLAGPLATMTLGDLGADVVKVERPGVGDDTRSWAPPYGPDGGSTYYLAVNRNKRGVTLDLSTLDGRTAARALALRADVLVENFPPGTMERFGLDYEQLADENPRLVYASVTGFGRGAGAALPGYDFLIQAVGGLMSITGEPNGTATKVGVALVDVLAGQNLVAGILAALYARQRTGRGQRVDVDLLGSLLAGLVNQASAYLNGGVVPGRLGNRHPSIAPYETLRTADRPIAIAVGNDGQFSRLCEALAVVGGERVARLPTDSRFLDNPSRVRHRDALVSVLEEVLGARPVGYWTAALSAAGVPCGAVNDIAEAFALADGLGLEPVVRQGSTHSVASPLRLSHTPVSYRLPPPELGQHDGEL